MSLAFLKREKNFIAVLEKDYPRYPEKDYPMDFLLSRLKDEVDELDFAINFQRDDIEGIKNELADISNLTDYLFEQCIRLEKND